MSTAEWLQTLGVGLVIRSVAVLGCLRFLTGLLSSDIRMAIDETGDGVAASDSRNGSPLATPVRDRGVWLAGSATSSAQRASYPRLARFVFCASFAESCMLFALVVFGDVLNARSRRYNWNVSLGSLLALIVLVIPLGQCLLVTYRNKSSSVAISGRTLLLTFLLFAGYLFAFLQIGNYLSSLLGVSEGRNTLGLFTNVLERICVPGVILIASLSGFGAVNTAWEAFEWRSLSKKEIVTDGIIQSAERALGRARADLQDRRADLNAAENAPVDNGGRSFFGRMLGSDSTSSKLSALRQEVAGLVAMEAQMQRDLHTLKSRKVALDLSKTWKGKLLSAVGIGFALYCAVRIVLVRIAASILDHRRYRAQSAVNLTFGYSNAPTDRGGVEEDLASQFLRHAIRLTGLSIDAERWSPVINLALIGTIIAANLRSVLAQVSRVLHATSAAVSASFLLLCLAQLMAIYLVTSLVALPASPGSSMAQLLDTLPDFVRFSRIFDGVFLFAALGTLAGKWLQGRIGGDDAIGLETFGRGDDGRGFV